MIKKRLQYLGIGVLLGAALLAGLQVGKLLIDTIDTALPVKESTFEDDLTQFVNAQKGEKRMRMATLQVFAGRVRGSAVNLTKGFALTASHVCEDMDAQQNTVQDFMGNVMVIEDYSRTDIYTASVDLCLIKFSPRTPLPEVKILDRSTDTLFRDVYMPGFQGGLNYSIVTAKVYAKNVIQLTGYSELRVLLFDKYIAPGHSGAGVFDKITGRLMSIVNASSPAIGDSAGAFTEDIYRFLCNPANMLAIDVRRRAIKCDQ